MARIIGNVSPDGECTLDFEGFAGESCLIASARLRAALAELGIQLADERVTLKPELSQPASQSNTSSGQQALHSEGGEQG